MTNTTTLRCTTREDLLGLPELLLRFAPTESLVLMHVLDSRIEFCLRIDAPAAIENPALILERIEHASASNHRVGGEWFSIGFTSEPRSLANSIHYVNSLWPDGTIAFLTDGKRSWRLDDEGHLVDEETCEPSSRASAALAVLRGQELDAERQDIVSRIPAWKPAPGSAERVRFVKNELTAGDRMDWMEEIIADPVADDLDTKVLGLLLVDDECAVELARSTKTWNADARLSMLLTMLADVPAESRANALGVTALASWLANEGVLACELMWMLEEEAPTHPMRRILSPMIDYAIPPSSWDAL